MKVFVLGGTGAIGRHVIPALVRAGYSVGALARTADKAAWLRDQGATPVSVSLFDRAALTTAFAGDEAVINLTSAMPPMSHFLFARAFENNALVRTEGSAAVADAALASGAGRLIQESVSMLYADCGARWIDEDAPIDWYPLAQANIAAESNARRFRDAGRIGIVLRFGWLYGPGATHSEQMFALARHHIAMVLGPPDSYVSSIHLADAAAAVVAAVQAPTGVFNIVDDEPLTKRAYAEALAAAAGTTIWVRAPGRAALLFGDRLTSLTPLAPGQQFPVPQRNRMGPTIFQRHGGLVSDRGRPDHAPSANQTERRNARAPASVGGTAHHVSSKRRRRCNTGQSGGRM